MTLHGSKELGVLFDVDGTLIDSNYLHTISWWQAFRRVGQDVPMASIHRAIGMGGDKLITHLLGEERNKNDDDVLQASHDAVFSTHWPALRPFAGAKDLLVQCGEVGLAVVLASSARQDELTVLRTALDADSCIDAATSSSDAAESKPAPDIVAAALESCRLQAGHTVFVGDSVWDVYAASKLNIPTIGLTCGGTSDAELREAGAVEVFAHPQALLQDLANSAIGRLLVRK
ncbi:HAD family hydrolase [Paenarthrobacter sp. Z7-10]|uniref:HAD family hydrolase n=1 Tax=Paenarthrobacter sp. Z7-10 TaxID=2787635 RepID=UPI0022A9EA2D|nr:HAD family hydrolase [Paenarthrobacter sp. Z7-10]MCZ2402582.1 HAD family hydrolase [Paenarthrobacter sp. Z7-10]